MKKLLTLLTLLCSCYPADMEVDIPGAGNPLRIHCSMNCPNTEKVRLAISDVATRRCYRDIPGIRATLADYALTWAEFPLYTKSGTQVLGATFHNRRAIYVWSDNPKAYGVYRWELGLAATERLLPGSSEREKIDFIDAHRCEEEFKGFFPP